MNETETNVYDIRDKKTGKHTGEFYIRIGNDKELYLNLKELNSLNSALRDHLMIANIVGMVI